LTNADRRFTVVFESGFELMFTSLYSNGVITSLPVTGVGRVGDTAGGGALAFFCGVLNGDGRGTATQLVLNARGGDMLFARRLCWRTGDRLRRRLFVMDGFDGDDDGCMRVSLTTVTPDDLMKFCKLLFISYINTIF
jgi:hypothetical protein